MPAILRFRGGLLVPALLACTTGCAEARDGAEPTEIARGRTLYRTYCSVSCHHPNPHKEHGPNGSFGPPIAGSSFALMRMRVLSKEYPEGYTPKRRTSLMTTFQLSDADLRALHAFVEAAPPPDDARK